MKQLHTIIIGDIPDERINQCLESWRCIENKYPHKIWSSSEVEDLIHTNYPQFIDMEIDFRDNMGLYCDIGRYLIMHNSGGIWVDWDIELHDAEKFTNAIEGKNNLMLSDGTMKSLCSEFMIHEKGSEFMIKVVEDIYKLYNKLDGDRITTTHYTGGYRLKESYTTHNPKIDVIDIKEMFRYDYMDIKWKTNAVSSNAPLTHYWLHTWVK